LFSELTSFNIENAAAITPPTGAEAGARFDFPPARFALAARGARRPLGRVWLPARLLVSVSRIVSAMH